MSRLYMMVTITDRNRKKKFEEFYEKNEHMVFFTTLGRGTANSEMLDYFGLEESEKVVILSVVTEETWKKLRREMIVKMQIDVPGTGIAFIVPLSSIGGEKTLHFLIQSEKFEREEESTLKEKCNHESHDGADRTCQQRKNNYIFPAGHKHSRT